MPNALVEEHIKQFAKDNNVSYGCALSMTECKVSYKKKNLCTTYDKPIGPVKYRKPHTMYDRVIGPVKPYPLKIKKKKLKMQHLEIVNIKVIIEKCVKLLLCNMEKKHIKN